MPAYNGSYNSFGSFAKRFFGTPVHKVNIDAGFTCPNRDGAIGTGGCIYCNNSSFRPSSCRPDMSVTEQIKGGIDYLGRRYGARRFLAYFQPFTNTYAPAETLDRLYREALSEPSVVGLAIGTRPDCIDGEKLDVLETLAKDRFILMEYGLQSVYDKSLRFINRGHDYETFLRTVELTNKRGIHTGAHIIVGLPTESREESLDMAKEVSGAGIRFLKIHQLQVVKDTPLAGIYEERPFRVFDYDEYLDFLVDFVERLSPSIVIQRLFATAPDEILVAPRWGKSRQEMLRDIEKRFKDRAASQGRSFAPSVRREKTHSAASFFFSKTPSGRL